MIATRAHAMATMVCCVVTLSPSLPRTWPLDPQLRSGERRKYLNGEDRAEFLRQVEKRMARIQSLVAEFKQEKTLKIFKNTLSTSGLLLFSRPDLLRWEIREPFHSILVVAGNGVGKFEYEDNKRKQLKLGGGEKPILGVMSQIRSWLSGKFEDGGEYYEVAVCSKPAPIIALRPRAEALRKNIEQIDVELTEDLTAVSRVTLFEKEGDKTEMRFQELRRDVALASEVFSVTDPRELDLERIKLAPVLAPREEG